MHKKVHKSLELSKSRHIFASHLRNNADNN